MADQNLFQKLKRMFSTDVIVRNVGGKRLKIVDTDQVQFATDRNSLRDRYNRLRSSTYNLHNRDMSMAYAAARLELFRDYDVMDMDPIIASALDIYSDECLVPSEFGYVLTIKSENENIKKILENLFYDILNIEHNLWSWTRNLTKYGDFFLRLEISPEYGVYLVQPISSYELTRIEGSDPNNVNYVKYQHDGLGGGMEYENFEIAHFRLLSDSNFLPYGKSMIEPARRIWKQLNLMEDAMLIHRIMRAPEKRIFKVDVGNIPPSEVDGYIEKMINKVKKVPYIDERTGDYNLRFNLNNMVEDFFLPVRGGDSGTSIDTLPGMEFTGTDDIEYLRNKMMAALKIPKAFLGYEEGLCLVPETEIRMLDGTHKTILQLIDDHQLGKKNYVYSIDPATNNVVAGEVESAQWTRKNAQLVRVHLDNGEHIDCTPDHNFMARDGSWVEAQNLIIGQSLMPIYTKDEVMYGKSDYEQVYNPGSDSWEWTHRVFDEQINGKRSRNDVIHHVDFNRKNNRPDNLLRMDRKSHCQLHAEHARKTFCSPECNAYKKTQEFRDKKSAERKRFIANNPAEIDRLKRNLAQYTMTPEELSAACKNGWIVSSSDRRQKLADDNKRHKKTTKMVLAARTSRGFSGNLPTIENVIDFCSTHGKYNTTATYQSLGCGRNYLYKLIYGAGYDSVDDFSKQFSSVKNHKVSRVEFLIERRDTCDITVKKYHNFATAAGVVVHNSGKATLAAEDVRFSRTIGRMQRTIVSELTKIAIVHLYVQGYKDASLVDFELTLNNPSTIFEQEKVAIWQDKVSLAKDMMESNCFSKKWLYTHLWNMSDTDVEEISDEIVLDKKQEWRIAQIVDAGNDPAKSSQKVDGDNPPEDLGAGGDLGSDEGGGASDTELPDLPELKEIEQSLGAPIEEEKERDQTGEKDASDYPYGEDPLGKLEAFRSKERDKPIKTNKLANPLKVNERRSPYSISMEEELKTIKRTLSQRNFVKGDKTVITEGGSMLDEKNLEQ